MKEKKKKDEKKKRKKKIKSFKKLFFFFFITFLLSRSRSFLSHFLKEACVFRGVFGGTLSENTPVLGLIFFELLCFFGFFFFFFF